MSNIQMALYRNLHALTLGTLVVVVFALAILQYRWVDQVSEAQEVRAALRVRDNLRRITDALDAEITRAVLVFTIPPVSGETTEDKLEHTWAAWHREAAWPLIVSAVWYLEPYDDGWQARSWGAAGSVDVGSMLSADDRVNRRGIQDDGHLEVQGRALFLDRRPCMLWPLPVPLAPPASPTIGRVLICYDVGYLTGTVFPHLLEKYSTAEDRDDFRFRLGPRESAGSEVMTADQFRYRPDCLIRMPDAGATLTVSGFSDKPDLPSERLTFAARFDAGEAFLTSLLRAEGSCKTGPRADSGLMQVSVRRPPGMLNDVFTRFRWRNVLVSSLVMLALLSGLIAVVVSTERARRLARFQTVIAAGISHELRSPLASLNVAADHLKHGHLENAEQGRRLGEVIDAQSRRLGRVVDQALALTRFNQSNGVAHDHAVSVCETIHTGCDGLAAQAKQANIEIERYVAPDAPLLCVDPDVLLRCLTNLVENSIKYAASGGWIRVSANRAAHAGRPALEVAVEDRGPGIEDDETTAVFEPFFRGSSARRSRQPGSGLGLAIVKSAVEACGGSMTLERAVPHGCRFRLFFPAAGDVGAVDSTRSKEPLDVVASHTVDRR